MSPLAASATIKLPTSFAYIGPPPSYPVLQRRSRSMEGAWKQIVRSFETLSLVVTVFGMGSRPMDIVDPSLDSYAGPCGPESKLAWEVTFLHQGLCRPDDCALVSCLRGKWLTCESRRHMSPEVVIQLFRIQNSLATMRHDSC